MMSFKRMTIFKKNCYNLLCSIPCYDKTEKFFDLKYKFSLLETVSINSVQTGKQSLSSAYGHIVLS